VSDASKSYLRQDSSLVDALISQQLFELGAMGCSFDAYRVEDLPELVQQPWLGQYRLMIFLDAVFVDQKTRQLVDQHLKKDGRHLLWLYGSGLIDENGAEPENMQTLTGFQLALENKNRGLWAHTVLTGSKLWYGTSQPIKPVVYGADPEAEAHWAGFSTPPNPLCCSAIGVVGAPSGVARRPYQRRYCATSPAKQACTSM
jgi:hypothetical protein